MHEQDSSSKKGLYDMHVVSSVNADLENNSFVTWFEETSTHDEKYVFGNIKSSKKIVVFITSAFLKELSDPESTSSEEFHYALTHKGSENFIPVVLDEEMLDQKKWSGAIIKLTALKYINMTSDVFRKKNMQQLFVALRTEPSKGSTTHILDNIESKLTENKLTELNVKSQTSPAARQKKVPSSHHKVIIQQQRSFGSDRSQRAFGSGRRAYSAGKNGFSKGQRQFGSGKALSWTVVRNDSRKGSKGPWAGGRNYSNSSYDNGAMSANKIQQMFDADMNDILEMILDHGESRNGGGFSISYSKLMEQCGEEREVLSGLLNRARNKGVVEFTGDQLAGNIADDKRMISLR